MKALIQRTVLHSGDGWRRTPGAFSSWPPRRKGRISRPFLRVPDPNGVDWGVWMNDRSWWLLPSAAQAGPCSKRPYDLNDALNSRYVLQGANSHPAG